MRSSTSGGALGAGLPAGGRGAVGPGHGREAHGQALDLDHLTLEAAEQAAAVRTGVVHGHHEVLVELDGLVLEIAAQLVDRQAGRRSDLARRRQVDERRPRCAGGGACGRRGLSDQSQCSGAGLRKAGLTRLARASASGAGQAEPGQRPSR